MNSDRLADKWDKQSIRRACSNSRRKMREYDPKVAAAHNSKILEGGLALLGKIQKTISDSIPNNCRKKGFHARFISS